MRSLNKAQTTFFLIVGALFLIVCAVWAHREIGGSRKTVIVDTGVATIKLDLPQKLPFGRSDEVRMEISTDKKRLEGRLTEPGANKLLAARLDLEGAKAFPNGITTQPVTDGNRFRFYWRLENEQKSPVSGVLWLWVSAVTADGRTVEKVPLASVPINITEYDLYGENLVWYLVLLAVVAIAGTFYLSRRN